MIVLPSYRAFRPCTKNWNPCTSRLWPASTTLMWHLPVNAFHPRLCFIKLVETMSQLPFVPNDVKGLASIIANTKMTLKQLVAAKKVIEGVIITP